MKDPISLTSITWKKKKKKKSFAHCGFELLVINFLVDCMLACANYVAKGQVAFMVLLSYPRWLF